MGDSVDALLADWERVDPDVDVTPVAVVARLGRIRARLDAQLDPLYRTHGLTSGDFAALSILRRAGDDGCPMGALADSLYLSGGTVTSRVARLVAHGLAESAPDPRDARTRVVRATEAGRERFDRVAPEHLRVEREALSVLAPDELAALAGLLSRLLTGLEQDTAAGGGPMRPEGNER